MSTYNIRNTADANPILVRAKATLVCGLLLTNKAGAARYLKVYDAAKASDVTVGTTVPVALVILPATTTVPIAQLHALCQLGLVIAITTGIADTDTGAPSAGDVVGQLQYSVVGIG
jgi:hypothetical protein